MNILKYLELRKEAKMIYKIKDIIKNKDGELKLKIFVCLNNHLKIIPFIFNNNSFTLL
jgi:hypothetical protein